jgi:hypothetical protein
VMQLARAHFNAPQLGLGMAEAHLRLKEHDEARRLVEAVLAAKPDLAEAKALLAKIPR